MKKFLVLLLLSPLMSFSQGKPVVSLKTYNFNLSKLVPTNLLDSTNLKLFNTSTQTVVYSIGNVEHLVTIPGNDLPSPSLHFINTNNNWVFEGFNSDVLMDGARNYSFLDNKGNFAYSNTGTESILPWPLGEIVVVRTVNGKIQKTKISVDKAFFHSVATGDLNNDGLMDVVGMHMGTESMRRGDKQYYWGVENFIPYTQNADGNFTENQDIISDPYNDKTWPGLHGGGAIIMADVMGDSRPELIKADYGFNMGGDRFSIAIFAFNKVIGKYQFVKTAKDLGVFSNLKQGATSIKAQDFNKDGFMDLAVASEGALDNGKDGGIVQIWLNDKDGNFSPGQVIVGQADLVQFREFEVGDVDGNGWSDIILHGGNGNLIKGIPSPTRVKALNLKYDIWLNTDGKFSQLEQDLIMSKSSQSNGSSVAPDPSFLKGFLINGKLKFYGFEGNCSNLTCGITGNNGFNLYEATVNFCKTATKPILSSNKLTFCSSDTLKLSIANKVLKDKYKWYFGSQVDSSNVTSKSFIDSYKLLIVKTDSLGCETRSDTLAVTKLAAVPTPSITNATPLTICTSQSVVLTSSGTNNQWYLNGNAIANATTTSFTANAAGAYKVKATNGDCSSPLSAASTVVVNPIPPTPTITLETNGGLTSSASDGNQWYFNDVKIDNATQKTINPTKSGNYTVKVITPCASEVSKPYNLVVTATEETILGQVQLSPNPFLSQFKVSFPMEFGKTAQVKIVDMSGNVHFKKASVIDGEQIDLANLNGGNYILHLNSNDNLNSKAIKISKIH